jgi:ribosomal protein L35
MAKKLKTRKSISKRIKITGRNKMLRRSGHQGHFNAKYPGSIDQKHSEVKEINATDTRKIKDFLNY